MFLNITRAVNILVLLILTKFIYSDDEHVLYSSKSGNSIIQEDTSDSKITKEVRKICKDKTKGLFLIIGHYSYFPELNSEKPMYIVNEVGRGMVPGWRDLITFKDLREIGLFGDIWAGIGVHCGKNFSLWSIAGGGVWKINNENQYGPLKLQLKLKGMEVFTEVGVDYYPFGKTSLSLMGHEHFVNKLKRILSQTKPYLSLSVSYSHFEASGDAKIKFFGFPVEYSRTKKIDVFSISPLIGFDFPITQRTDFFAGIGYLFGFDAKSFEREHKKDIEGPVFTTGIKFNF